MERMTQRRGQSLLESFNFAFEGIIHVLRTQRNMRIHFLAAVVVLVAGLAIGVSKLELIALLLAIAFVFITEMINSALEQAIDVATTSFDPLAKLAKDIAAGAVLIATVNAIAIGYLVFSSEVADRSSRVLERLRDAPERAFRIAVLHHHLIGAPWRSRKKPVARRNHVLVSLVRSGADLILAGHIHQAAVSERREFEISTGSERGVVVSIAPGLGQPRPKRHGEARGLHVYEVEDTCLRVHTFVWRRTDWGLTAERQFPRGREPLASEPV